MSEEIRVYGRLSDAAFLVAPNQEGGYHSTSRTVPSRFHALLELRSYIAGHTTRFFLKQVGTDIVWPMTIDKMLPLLKKLGTAAPGLFDGLWEVKVRRGYLTLAMVPVEDV